MASDFLVYVKVKPYLKKYAEKRWGNPIVFPKKSSLNVVLFEYLCHKDNDLPPVDKTEYIAVALPRFTKKNIDYYNSLTEAGKRTLRSDLSDLLFIDYFRTVMRQYKQGRGIDTPLYHFIEEWDLPEDCFRTFRKRIQRNMDMLGIKTEKFVKKQLKVVCEQLQLREKEAV